MTKYKFKDIVENAKNHSSYYKNLYNNLEIKDINSLPIVDQETFWKSSLLTAKESGIVFKSGGSTGNPKYSYFTNDEWDEYTKAFGEGLSRSILKTGDKVANLFYGGDLYASFFFIKDSLRYTQEHLALVHFPIAGQTEFKNILNSLNEFQVNVLCGIPSALILLLNEYEKSKDLYPKIKIDRILYGGEGLYKEQKNYIQSLFPTIEVASIGCASVDGGMIGYSSPDCQDGEHRVLEDVGIIEIVDPDTLLPISEKNKVGKMLLTNLTRKLMPIIRYPSGDMAMWIDDDQKNRKFKLCGRSDEAARLGTLSVYFEETRQMIMDILKDDSESFFQIKIKHYDYKDELVFCLYSEMKIDELKMKERILLEFKKSKRTYEELLAKNLIHPLVIEFKKAGEVIRNERTGKSLRIIDERK